MNKAFAAVLIGATLLSSAPAFARDHGRDDRGWNHGGYQVGGRYPNYNQRRYVIEDYRAYRLPPPRYGYRYYRDDNGDIVMAAIASGLIGLIIGSSINDHGGGYYDRGYGPPPPPPRPYYGYPPAGPYPYGYGYYRY